MPVPIDESTQASLLVQRGIEAAGAGRVDEAVAAFQNAVALRPDLAAAHANLGLLLAATQRHAQAEAHLRIALSFMPGDAMLHMALGVAEESLGRLADAEASHRTALALRPELAEAHASLGNCLRRQGRLDAAQPHCERALELQPGFGLAHYNLGVLLQERGDVDAAIAQYRAALRCRADHVEALINLGSCLRSQGLLQDARDAFERTLALRPHQLEAHWNLSQLKTYAPGDPQVESLLSQEPRLASLPETSRIRYWFIAGKMLEDVGRHDDAFAAYAQGNRLKHAQAAWDEAADVDLQRRIVATFTRPVLDREAASEAVDGPVPVFVLGMPRSGTSLLEQVLATLPGVHGAGEITTLAEVLDSAASEFGEAGYRFPETLAGASTATLRRLGRRYVERVRALAPQATHVVDKLPANFTHVGLIHLLLPNARIVHAMRDPMDACFSCYSRLFSANNLGFTYELATLGRYWVRYHALMRHWHAVLPEGRILDVSYETMVADVENQARRVVEYLGLPWDERCLGFHSNERVVRTASVAQVRRPIYRTSVARWQRFQHHLGALHEVVKDYR
jgi:tetratricopeptide (TPR) repeat protein